jgi:hypothetical protein
MRLNYTKYLSGNGVNYPARITTNEMIEKAKQGILTEDEATKVSYSAISAYCDQFSELKPIP